MATQENPFRAVQMSASHDGVSESLNMQVLAIRQSYEDLISYGFLVVGLTGDVNQRSRQCNDI